MMNIGADHAKWIKSIVLVLFSMSLLCVGFWVAGTEKVLHDFQLFPAWAVVGVVAAFGLNLFVVSFRLGRLLEYFGIHLPFGIILKASLQGHFAALFLISLFGQVAGRQWVLRHHGTPSVFIATLTAIERAVLFLVSGGLCLLGAVWLLNSAQITAFFSKISFVQYLLAATLSLVISVWIGHSKFEKSLFTRICSKNSFINILDISLITLLAQSMVLIAFVLGGMGLAPELDFWKLMAAAAITSFAASLPISVNGWGVRELAAVFAFGSVGMPESSALALSILVGLCSTAVVLAAFPLVLIKKSDEQLFCEETIPQPSQYNGRLPVEKIGAWVISVATGILIFFQFHVPLSNGVLNINLADAFALISLAAVVSHAISSRSLPVWRVRKVNYILLAISSLLLFSFVHGIQAIGVTQWALVGRLLGWMVLLGYLSIGILTISYLGLHGIRRLFETMVVTAGVVVIFEVVVRWLAPFGWFDASLISLNFEGYAGNRNAFAFQLLACSVLLVAYTQHHNKVARRLRALSTINTSPSSPLGISRDTLFILLHGLILAGLVFTGSRAGILTGAILLIYSWVSGLINSRTLLKITICSLLIWLFLTWFFPSITWLLLWVSTVISENNVAFDSSIQSFDISVQSSLSNGISNIERWETIRRGLEMWWNSPVLGSGLGVFIEKSSLWFDKPTVIHSTPVWILVEFGLIGAAVLLTAFGSVAKAVHRNESQLPYQRAVILLLLVFAIFSQVHEIFYQRVFWLILGMCLALPFKNTPQENRA